MPNKQLFIDVTRHIRYEVVIFDTPRHGFTREATDGFCDERERRIYISSAVQVDRRALVLRHEAVHAWDYHLPQPKESEALANWMANVWAAVEADMRDQDGWKVLESLQSIDGPKRQ